MSVLIGEEPASALADVARVPIAFVVDRVLVVTLRDGGLGGVVLDERPCDPPYVKDYDADGEAPDRLAERFDLSNWGVLVARADGTCVGAAVVAFDTDGVDLLEGRRDLAVVWDLRVAPVHRGRGVGAALFRAAEAWALARGCRTLKVETQNVNVGACRFYARQGCVLGALHRHAYPTLPHETQLLWYKPLSAA